jgi:hypothetical protein
MKYQIFRYLKKTQWLNSECLTVVANDNARGERCQVLVLDEGRMMNKAIVATVLEPFLTEKRTPPYLLNPKYKEYAQKESNKEIFLSSIGTPSDWSYRDFVNACNFIAAGDRSYNVMALPYQFGLETGIIDRAFIERQIREEKADIQSFQMEMEVIPYGESEYSLFTFDELNGSRKLRVPMIPITNDEYIEFNGNISKSTFYRRKEAGELRVVVMDVAVSSAKNSDNTIICVFSLFENNMSKTNPFYDKELSYIESMNGIELDKQVLRFKQIFYNLECDFAVIDGNAALGINTYDTCAQVTNDYFRNTKYPAWREHPMSPSFERPFAVEADPILYGIKTAGAASGELQYSMLIKSKLNLERGRLKLLANEDDVEDELNRRYKFVELKSSNDAHQTNKARAIIMPFINTTSLIDEAVRTQVVRSQTGRIMFKEEKTTARKDRIITMMYGIYFISLLEDKLRVQVPKMDYTYAYHANQRKNITKNLFGRKEIGGFVRSISPFNNRK